MASGLQLLTLKSLCNPRCLSHPFQTPSQLTTALSHSQVTEYYNGIDHDHNCSPRDDTSRTSNGPENFQTVHGRFRVRHTGSAPARSNREDGGLWTLGAVTKPACTVTFTPESGDAMVVDVGKGAVPEVSTCSDKSEGSEDEVFGESERAEGGRQVNEAGGAGGKWNEDVRDEEEITWASPIRQTDCLKGRFVLRVDLSIRSIPSNRFPSLRGTPSSV